MTVFELLSRIAKRGGLILLISLAAGCNFDGERQYNIRFPASLIIKNETAGNVVINNIRSSPEAKGTFSLKGSPMGPGESFTLRVAESDYRDLLAGSFVLLGSCGDKAPWEVPGGKLSRKGISDAQRWDVTVSISTCGP
jgi:hypothetical protein